MRLCVMGIQPEGSAAALAMPHVPAGSGPADRGGAAAEASVTALYEGHALGLVRLAYVMLGDRAAAEDVVQEAFGRRRHVGLVAAHGRSTSVGLLAPARP
jgi:hypothetical protein